MTISSTLCWLISPRWTFSKTDSLLDYLPVLSVYTTNLITKRMVYMTDYQKWQIESFRRKGAGYKSIATLTGLSRDIVRNYCKSHKVPCDAELEQDMAKLVARGLACRNCGNELTRPHTGRPRSFCCDECRFQWWSNHGDLLRCNSEALYSITCANCGKVFTSYGNAKRKYCCHECYVMDRFYRK